VELLTVLSAIMQENRSQFEIIIALDALDECPDRGELLKSITALTNMACGVKILLTSRPEDDIQTQIGPIATGVVQILDKAQDDVERFVIKELEDEAFADYGQEIHNAIKAKLLSGSDRYNTYPRQLQ
jgi:hypothetical protein